MAQGVPISHFDIFDTSEGTETIGKLSIESFYQALDSAENPDTLSKCICIRNILRGIGGQSIGSVGQVFSEADKPTRHNANYVASVAGDNRRPRKPLDHSLGL